jgi:tetratricopeptide (TPR) repeat protein
VAQVKHARSYDPLSVDALLELAALEAANGNPSSALQHYVDAVKLEPENAQASYELGAFYFEYKQWRPAYDALNNSYTYDRFGPASKTCGLLDQARAKAFNYSGTPPRVLKSCPGLRRPAKP